MKLTALTALLVIALIGCSKKGEVIKPPPVQLTRADSCKICGMIIVDFPGPKAQIHYSNGKVDKFCSVIEMMTFYLQPDRPRNIVAIYVQDMAKADWQHPVDHWIDAERAFYVYGAQVTGPMGDELIPFSDRKSAEAFIEEKGGKLLRFNEITMDLLKPRA